MTNNIIDYVRSIHCDTEIDNINAKYFRYHLLISLSEWQNKEIYYAALFLSFFLYENKRKKYQLIPQQTLSHISFIKNRFLKNKITKKQEKELKIQKITKHIEFAINKFELIQKKNINEKDPCNS